MNNITLNTKILTITTVFYLGIMGFILTFFPQEIANFFEESSSPLVILALQFIGALYLGFGMMNWMTKNKLIGGIYSRPLVFGNFMHFLIAALSLIKSLGRYSKNQLILMICLSIVLTIFTLCFGYLLKTNPIKNNNNRE